MSYVKSAFFLFFIFLLALSLVSCEGDPEFMAKIDAEIAWGNAERLSVTVDFPPQWGSSPQLGTGRCFDNRRVNENPRLGYDFNVEFSPLPGYGFEKWLAFSLSVYNGLNKTESAADVQNSSLNGVEIIESISSTGARVATVTINTSEPVTLVPWCTDRPVIIQTNPPLINTGDFYNRGQRITIWMNLGFDKDTELAFGEDLIQISGQYIRNNMLPYNEDGDITGYFEIPRYIAERKAIIIDPNPDNFPPGNLNITVTVGTGIIGANNLGMRSSVIFSYRINDQTVTEAYKASDIWAIHDPDNNPRVSSFFYQMAPEERDRRLRKNKGKYEVTLYFNVSRSVSEIEEPKPECFIVYEIYYCDLAGRDVVEITENNIDLYVRETEYKLSTQYITPNGIETVYELEDNTDSAGIIYSQLNNSFNPLGVYYYKAVYTFDNVNPRAGIYRLAILPRREGVREDDLLTLIDEGRFVTVVIENIPPNNNGKLLLSGHYSTTGSAFNYSNNRLHRTLIINTNFSNIEDNHGIGGISLSEATPNKPWTKDEQRNLQWQWRIVNTSGGSVTFKYVSGWLQIGANPLPLTLSRNIIPDYNKEKTYFIEVQFRDALEHTSEWNEMEKIRYSDPLDDKMIENWWAEYNDGIITVEWEQPDTVNEFQITLIEKASNTEVGDPITVEADENNEKAKVIITQGIKKIDNTNFDIVEYIIELRNIDHNGNPDNSTLITGNIWNVNGIKVENNKQINVFIVKDFTDNDNAQNRPGTFRHAITNARDNDYICFSGVRPGIDTIALTSALPEINRNLTIEGNGITLTRDSDMPVNNASQMLRTRLCDVKISRVHFKDGRAINLGAVIFIYENTTVTFESCIFSGNETSFFSVNDINGGAIFNAGTLIVRGCTFYNNRVGNRGSGRALGASIWTNHPGASVSIHGNIFYNNRAFGGTNWENHVVYGPVAANSFNVVDVPMGIARTQSGFGAGTGDISILSNPASRFNYKIISRRGAERIIANVPPDYPTVDFYGNPIPKENASAGAVQAIDEDNGDFIVNNFSDDPDSETTRGTLRYALKNVQNGDVISFKGVTAGVDTVALTRPLPEISIDLSMGINGHETVGNGIFIIGRGITITREPNKAENNTSQLFRINNDVSTFVSINTIHFKDGRATNNGSAIHNVTGILYLEFCIFSGNETNGTTSAVDGGAIRNHGELYVRNCTFYNNRVINTNSGTARGAAIYTHGATHMAYISGNMFYDNKGGGTNGFIYGGTNSYGCNAVDVPLNQSGFNTYTGNVAHRDVTFMDLGFPNNETLPFTSSATTGISAFVPRDDIGTLRTLIPNTFNVPLLRDFYGNERTWPIAPGAVSR